MSWIDDLKIDLKADGADKPVAVEPAYQPTVAEREALGMMRKNFSLGYVTQQRPRVEFSDLSVLVRDQTDWLAFNTYQPNNGDPFPGDQINGWRSNAVRPTERNKVISIAAHATSRLLYPKISAFTEGSEYQELAAQVMRDLMEWVAEHYGYAYTMLKTVIQALVAPAGIVHVEYSEVYREVKRELLPDGTYRKEQILDEDLSGFRSTIVPVDQLFIENFYEPDIQKQGWLIWRRVQNFDMMKEKYGHLPNFKFVKPGVQVLYNDANQGFYYVYDPAMRQYECEEVIMWHKGLDLRIVEVNGILLTRPDEKNPREDKLYPFPKTFYEFITNRCFYGKSLVFKVSHDAMIINTLYPMIIDGTYLSVMPAFFATSNEIIGSDVMVPGKVTTFTDPQATLNAIKPPSDLKSGLDVMAKVEESINETSESPSVQDQGAAQTAYAISVQEQQRREKMGPFLQMIGDFVLQYGRLVLGDIKQYLTVADVQHIEDDPKLIYKVFFKDQKSNDSKHKVKKIMFDNEIGSDHIEESHKTLKAQKSEDVELWRVNPELFRNLSFVLTMTPDVLMQRSDDVEKMFDLETYDRLIQNPKADQDMALKTFLLSNNPKSARDPDKFVMKQQEGPGGPGGGPPQPGQPPQGMMPPGMNMPQPPQPAMQGAMNQ